MPEKILYFGCYSPLAGARTLILQQQGFNVVCSVDPNDAPQICAAHDIDLIVVCNSCDDELAQTLSDALSQHSMFVPILRLDSDHSNAWRDPELLGLLIRGKLRQFSTPEVPMKHGVESVAPNLDQRRRA